MTRKRERPRLTKIFPEKSATKQSFAEECDINNIMAKYRVTGLVDHTSAHGGVYTDLPTEIDYHENLNSVIAAEQAFQSLPAKMRAKFDNDPAKFLGFVLNPDNKAEIDEMGLGLHESPPAAPAAPAPAPDPEPEPGTAASS